MSVKWYLFTLRLLDCEVESLSHFTLFGLGFKKEKKNNFISFAHFSIFFFFEGYFY